MNRTTGLAQQRFYWSGLISLLFLVGCVTINVYFPEAAATQAADKVVCEIVGNCEGDKSGNPQSDRGGAGNDLPVAALLPRVSLNAARPAASPPPLAVALLNALLPAAHAQAASIDVNSPASDAIQARMKARQSQLREFLDSGAVGYTSDGLVDLRDLAAVPLPKRTLARKLVSDENADRRALYKEIARINGHPEWEGQVRDAFADRWIARANPGWYYQNSGGGWQQK